ncbi:MAG: hypothetical protein ACLGHJ_06575 [Gammaproteobacteria bacterium]
MNRPAILLLSLLLPLAGVAADPVVVTHPRIAEARQALAAGDATGAKIALNMLAEETQDRALLRTARRMLDIDVNIAEAGEQVRRRQLFLVEGTLRAAERRLGKTAGDQPLRDRIAAVRRAEAEARKELAREDAHMAIAVRSLLETEKLVRGDYPLLREDAERLLLPALRQAGDDFALVDWKPTLRGYRLMLQDKRTGDSFEVTPD